MTYVVPGFLYTNDKAFTFRRKISVWNFRFFFNSILLGVGLAMDAFSVSMSNGLNEPGMKKQRMCILSVSDAYDWLDLRSYHRAVFSSV